MREEQQQRPEFLTMTKSANTETAFGQGGIVEQGRPFGPTARASAPSSQARDCAHHDDQGHLRPEKGGRQA
jgi:hypothetical protein